MGPLQSSNFKDDDDVPNLWLCGQPEAFYIRGIMCILHKITTMTEVYKLKEKIRGVVWKSYRYLQRVNKIYSQILVYIIWTALVYKYL